MSQKPESLWTSLAVGACDGADDSWDATDGAPEVAPGEEAARASATESLRFRGLPNRRGRPYLHSALTRAHRRQGSPVMGDLSHRSLWSWHLSQAKRVAGTAGASRVGDISALEDGVCRSRGDLRDGVLLSSSRLWFGWPSTSSGGGGLFRRGRGHGLVDVSALQPSVHLNALSRLRSVRSCCLLC